MNAGLVAVDELRRWREALDAFAAGIAAGQRALIATEAPEPGIAHGSAPGQRASTPGEAPDPGIAAVIAARSADHGDARREADEASTAVWPPAELPTGPVPDVLRAEAEALLQQADALRDELLAAMQRSRPTGRRAGSPMTASPRWSVRL